MGRLRGMSVRQLRGAARLKGIARRRMYVLIGSCWTSPASLMLCLLCHRARARRRLELAMHAALEASPGVRRAKVVDAINTDFPPQRMVHCSTTRRARRRGAERGRASFSQAALPTRGRAAHH